MLTTQGINKPVFYAYQFLNQLGNTELVNQDAASIACKDEAGNIQVLAWDFTYTLPDSTNNQQYYIRDLPSKSKGQLKVNLTGLPEGLYSLQVYQVGYRVNDAHTAYGDLGRPQQLTNEQVEHLKKMSDGAPVYRETVRVKGGSAWVKELPLRENDVYFLSLVKL
jgi:xylan 1,4-beta-xylosidase